MIIVRIMGGLGNQMFQYAFYRALQECGKDARLDLSWYNTFQAHNGYELKLLFNIKEVIADESSSNRLGYTKYSLKNRIQKKFFPKKTFYQSSVEESIQYMEQFFSVDDMYLAGYWQSEKYFSFIEEKIREEFTFKLESDDINKKYLTEMAATESVSLHVRRGDYLGSSTLNVCTENYYKNAIAYFRERIINPVFYVFSNDMKWCQENIIGSDIKYININAGEKSYNDMRLMSTCKHNIIANSSFSWWGAWLNMNADKIVASPDKWVNTVNLHLNTDVLPASWKKIEI